MATPRNQSVLKAFAMFKCFDSADQWLTNSELSRRANLPKASGYRLIQTLREMTLLPSLCEPADTTRARPGSPVFA